MEMSAPVSSWIALIVLPLGPMSSPILSTGICTLITRGAVGAISSGPSAEAARAQVNAIANPTNPEVGEQFLGTVVKIATFGAFISLLPGKDGLLHVSEVRKLAGGKRVENVEDVLNVGQKILVKITKIDDRGKLSLEPVTDEPADQEGRAAANPGPEAPAEG